MSIEATVWRPTDGNGEYTSITPVDIVDPLGNNLVDPSGNQIVSTDTQLTPVAQTIWIENEEA